MVTTLILIFYIKFTHFGSLFIIYVGFCFPPECRLLIIVFLAYLPLLWWRLVSNSKSYTKVNDFGTFHTLMKVHYDLLAGCNASMFTENFWGLALAALAPEKMRVTVMFPCEYKAHWTVWTLQSRLKLVVCMTFTSQ